MPEAVRFDDGATSCSTSCDTFSARIVLNGARNSVIGGDLVGDPTEANADGVTIKGDGCSVASAVTVRQWSRKGIAWDGTAANVEIGAVSFASNGEDIGSILAFATHNAPVIPPGTTDKTRTYADAATLTIAKFQAFVQVSGATEISTIDPHGAGKT